MWELDEKEQLTNLLSQLKDKESQGQFKNEVKDKESQGQFWVGFRTQKWGK